MIHFISNHNKNSIGVCNYLTDAAKILSINHFWSKKPELFFNDSSFVLKVDDGDIDNFDYKKINTNCALWLIDSHTDINRALAISQNFDFVFCAQKNAVEILKSYGISCSWLPLACDSNFHTSIYPQLKQRPFDVGFSGSTDNCGGWNNSRPKFLESIKSNFKNHLISRSNKGQNTIINGSCKIIVNQNVNNDINMRFFEAVSSGSIVVTPQIKDNGFEQFEKSGSVFVYENYDEAIDMIKYAIDNIESLEKSAKDLSTLYKQKHSYAKRLEQIIYWSSVHNKT